MKRIALSVLFVSTLSAFNSTHALAAMDEILWDYWYTVTLNKTMHYEYYNERAERKKGRIFVQNHAWKLEEKFINEEQLGVFATDNSELTPLFFNFHSTYRSTETTIDGNVKDGKQLTVRIRKGNTEQPMISKSISPKVFWSGIFPVWLGQHLQTFKPNQSHSFQTILEDNVDAGFATTHGQLRLEAPDEFAQRTHTQKLTLDYRDVRSIWYIEASGAPIRIEMPLQKTLVERVPEAKAKAFLKK